MRNFITVTNTAKDKDLRVTNQIRDYISERGGSVISYFYDEAGAGLASDIKEIPVESECILVLGGDGTLIRTATRLGRFHIPLLGINLGTLGYLCELEEENLFPALDRLLDGQYMIENRMMIEGYKEGSEEVTMALNDIVIHRIGDLSTIPLSIYVNHELVTSYLADGIIVSTPTGSTAYNMSAGGPIVDPKSRMLLVTPINAHNLNSKSIVFEADDVIEIQMGERRSQKDEVAGVSFDGDSLVKLHVGEKIVISESKAITKICKINKTSFIEILRKKMNSLY